MISVKIGRRRTRSGAHGDGESERDMTNVCGHGGRSLGISKNGTVM